MIDGFKRRKEGFTKDKNIVAATEGVRENGHWLENDFAVFTRGLTGESKKGSVKGGRGREGGKETGTKKSEKKKNIERKKGEEK